MGVLLGGFIEGDPDQLEGATSYLAFVVPGLVAAHAMQTAVGETTYPVMGMIKWQQDLRLDARHARWSPGTWSAPTWRSWLFRLATTCGVFMLVLAPFGVFETWWGPLLAFLRPGAGRDGVRDARLRAQLPDADGRPGFGVLFRLGVFPLFLFSGAFFPVSNLGDVGARLARLTPLWHGVNLSRMFALDNVDWWHRRDQRRRPAWRSRPRAGAGRSPASRSG